MTSTISFLSADKPTPESLSEFKIQYTRPLTSVGSGIVQSPTARLTSWRRSSALVSLRNDAAQLPRTCLRLLPALLAASHSCPTRAHPLPDSILKRKAFPGLLVRLGTAARLEKSHDLCRKMGQGKVRHSLLEPITLLTSLWFRPSPHFLPYVNSPLSHQSIPLAQSNYFLPRYLYHDHYHLRLYFPLPPQDTHLSVIRNQLAEYTQLPPASFKLIHAGAIMKDDNAPSTSPRFTYFLFFSSPILPFLFSSPITSHTRK